MIIGLVLFVIVSLVLYISKSVSKKQSDQNVHKIQQTALDTQPIKEFIAKCLDKVTKDAVLLLGHQGGYIYSSQGGTMLDYLDTDQGLFFVDYGGYKVAYNILPPKFTLQQYYSDAPDYPWQTFPYNTSASNEEIFNGYFGISNLPPLNASGGSNSIQTQLETFIDKNIYNCLDFRFFENEGFKIDVNISRTQVVIGNNDITVASKLPINIKKTATQETSEISEFSTNLNIRLKDIYFFTKELIDNDIKNIKFNIKDTNNNKNFINVKLIEDVFSSDDIIVIRDDKSLVNGNPLEYIFARKNRAPALYYLKKNTMEFPQGYEITKEDLLQNSELRAEDADEDNYSFTISPPLPKVLNTPQIKFKVEVSDGKLSDYQIITINRI